MHFTVFFPSSEAFKKVTHVYLGLYSLTLYSFPSHEKAQKSKLTVCVIAGSKLSATGQVRAAFLIF